MLIEIVGVGNHNKGAEMMLLTILQELKSDNVNFCVDVDFNCKYECYSKYNLYPKFKLSYKKIPVYKIVEKIPKRYRELFGFVIDEEVDVILDASGFAYSSQWGVEPTKRRANYYKKMKEMGKKIILLPQAFGPFENREIKKYMKDIIDNVDLIFARDEFSYNELIKIKKEFNKIQIFSDFTNILEGKIPSYWSNELNICIVVNQRMKDKVKADNYEKVLAKIITYFQSTNLKPFFLIFAKEDKNLANKVNALLENKIPIIEESNPVYTKGIISTCKGLIGSRFHSLVTALSSNVIALGIGWSHKYKYLFKEYKFEEGLLDLNNKSDRIFEKLDLIVSQNIDIKNKIKMVNKFLKHKSKDMFRLIKKELEL